MSTIIDDKNSELWKRLYKLWLKQGKPGWVVLRGGDQYRVLHPGDDAVKFERSSGFDAYYGSQSKGAS